MKFHLISDLSCTGSTLLLGVPSQNPRFHADPFIIDALNGALAEGADLFLYGCKLGKDEVCLNFHNALHRGADLDVAASDILTGKYRNSGRWVFEVSV